MTEIIISYHQRPNNMKQMLKYIIPLLNDNMILTIVEWNYKETIKFQHKYLKYIFIESESTFNKGYCYNYAVKDSHSDNLIFLDCDIIIKRKSFELIDKLKEYDVVKPYKYVMFLNRKATDNFVNNNFKLEFEKDDIIKSVQSGVISGGCFFIKKDKFLETGGFDEDCYGYGYEDDIFDLKMKNLNFKTFISSDVSLHLFHDIDKNYHSKMSNNKKLWMEYKSMSKDKLRQKIINSRWTGQQ